MNEGDQEMTNHDELCEKVEGNYISYKGRLWRLCPKGSHSVKGNVETVLGSCEGMMGGYRMKRWNKSTKKWEEGVWFSHAQVTGGKK